MGRYYQIITHHGVPSFRVPIKKLQIKIPLKVAFKDAFFITIEIIGLYVPISDVYILYNKHQDVLSTTILYHCKKIPKY